MRDNCPWDPEITPLTFRVDQLTFSNSIDSDRFRDLPQHRIVMKRSSDIHGEAGDVTSMIITGMSPQHRTFLPLLKSPQMFLTASVSTSGCFPDVLMAANLTYQLISNTGAATKPFSASAADQTIEVVTLLLSEWV